MLEIALPFPASIFTFVPSQVARNESTFERKSGIQGNPHPEGIADPDENFSQEAAELCAPAKPAPKRRSNSRMAR
jgi:hypothetical protein